MIIPLTVALMLASAFVGFKVCELIQVNKRESSRINHPSVTVEPPATINGSTIYLNYDQGSEEEFWKNKG